MKKNFLTLVAAFALSHTFAYANDAEYPVKIDEKNTVENLVKETEAEKETETKEEVIQSIKKSAQIAAVGDSVSTYLALSAGGVELNPIVNTSPIGLVALAGAKLLVLDYVDKNYVDDERVQIHNSLSSVFTFASVNNLLIALSATGPVAIVGGVIAGVISYNYYDNKYKEVLKIK